MDNYSPSHPTDQDMDLDSNDGNAKPNHSSRSHTDRSDRSSKHSNRHTSSHSSRRSDYTSSNSRDRTSATTSRDRRSSNSRSRYRSSRSRSRSRDRRRSRSSSSSRYRSHNSSYSRGRRRDSRSPSPRRRKSRSPVPPSKPFVSRWSSVQDDPGTPETAIPPHQPASNNILLHSQPPPPQPPAPTIVPLVQPVRNRPPPPQPPVNVPVSPWQPPAFAPAPRGPLSSLPPEFDPSVPPPPPPNMMMNQFSNVNAFNQFVRPPQNQPLPPTLQTIPLTPRPPPPPPVVALEPLAAEQSKPVKPLLDSSNLLDTLMSKAGLTVPSVTPTPISSIDELSPMKQIHNILNTAVQNANRAMVKPEEDGYVPPPLPMKTASTDLFDAIRNNPLPPSESSAAVASVPDDARAQAKARCKELAAKKNRSMFTDKREWQDRIALEVKCYLKPAFAAKKISKQDYMDIMRKAVTKISRSGMKTINTDKIGAFVKQYIKKYRRHNKKLSMAQSSSVNNQSVMQQKLPPI